MLRKLSASLTCGTLTLALVWLLALPAAAGDTRTYAVQSGEGVSYWALTLLPAPPGQPRWLQHEQLPALGADPELVEQYLVDSRGNVLRYLRLRAGVVSELPVFLKRIPGFPCWKDALEQICPGLGLRRITTPAGTFECAYCEAEGVEYWVADLTACGLVKMTAAAQQLDMELIDITTRSPDRIPLKPEPRFGLQQPQFLPFSRH